MIARSAAAMSFAMLVAAPAVAQTTQDPQIWLNATVMGVLPHSRITYFVEAQPRSSSATGGLQQLILRPAIGLRLSNQVTVYGGYAHVTLPRDGEPDRTEERTFAQLSWTLPKRGPGTLSSRTRLEHRRLSNGRDTGWRARELVRYVHPIRDPAAVRALVSAELFVAFNDTDWGARAGFNQLRSFVGLELPLPGKSTVEAGYLNQYVNDPGGRRQMNHVASLTLFIRP